MKLLPILPPGADEPCVPDSSEDLDRIIERHLDEIAEALAEVDSIVAWSDEGGWSHGDLTQVIQVDDGLDDDEDAPPTARSPSGIRLSVASGRPVAVIDDESSPRAIDEATSSERVA